jgi:hypothetical protein
MKLHIFYSFNKFKAPSSKCHAPNFISRELHNIPELELSTVWLYEGIGCLTMCIRVKATGEQAITELYYLRHADHTLRMVTLIRQ